MNEAYYNKKVLKMIIQATPFLKTQDIKDTSKHGGSAQAIQCKFRTNWKTKTSCFTEVFAVDVLIEKNDFNLC